MKKTVTEHNVLRYNRQIALPQFDIDGQETLLNAKVLLIGLGGLGCACAQYLAASGVGALTLVDDDKVDVSNLQRQVLHKEKTVGQLKVESAHAALSAINSEVDYTLLAQRLDDIQLAKHVQNSDIVVDCCDNLATREQLNRLCWQNMTPLVSGAAIRIEGQLMAILPELGGPCYACVSQLFGEQNLSCSETGVLSPIVGIVGASQALLAIKVLADLGASMHGVLQLFDGATMQWQHIRVPKHPNCTICGA